RQIRMPVEVTPGNYGLLDVNGVLSDKTMVPVIECLAELCRSRFGSKQVPVKPDPKVGPPDRHRRRIRLALKAHLPCLSVVGRVDPIVHTETKIGDLCFRIVFKKAGKEYLAAVGATVAGGVFQK